MGVLLDFQLLAIWNLFVLVFALLSAPYANDHPNAIRIILLVLGIIAFTVDIFFLVLRLA